MKKIQMYSLLIFLILLTMMLPSTIISQDKNTDSETSDDTPKQSVLWRTIGGMTGEITTEIKLVDQTNAGFLDTVLVGTDGGAMAIDLLSGEVHTRYTTLNLVLSITNIADIDDKGRTDFVITTLDQQLPNVIAVSTETGEKLWEFKPMVDAYTDEDGLIESETISWCVDSIPTGNGMDVIVSSWRIVYRLSGDNGDVLWKFTGGNDIWNVVSADDLTGDNKHDVLAGSQDGDIHLLNGETGDEVWVHDLTEKYEMTIVEDPKKGEDQTSNTETIIIDLSLWSIITIEDVDRDSLADVVVSSEDGFITLISGDSGDIIWSKKITLQNEPDVENEEQTGIDDLLNFFNPRIKTIDDFDGDGLRDILVMGITRNYEGTAKIISSSTGATMGTRQGGKDRDPGGKTNTKDNTKDNDDPEVVELDEESILFTTTGTDALDIPVIWSTEAIMNLNGSGNYSLLLPHNNKIKLIDTITKNTTVYFDHPILDNAWLGRFQLEFFDNPNGSQDPLMIITLGTSGLLVVDPQTQEVLWDVNNLESVEVKDIEDITGDGTDDLLVQSSLGASSLIRSVYTIDRVTGEEVWKYSVSLSDLSTKGARGINIENDFTGDGNLDVLSFRQSDDGGKLLERGNHSFVFVLDGTTGNLVWERQVTNQLFFNATLTPEEGLYEDFNAVNRRIASLDTAPDLSGDSIPDIIVGGQSGKVYLLDGSNGMQLWNQTNANISWLPWYPQIFAVEDDSNVGLLITDFSSMIFFSNLTTDGGLSANYSWRYPENLSNPDNHEILSDSFRLIDDINGDSRSDVMYFSVIQGEKVADVYECHILSGLDGSALGPGFSVGVGYPPQDNFAPRDDPDDGPFLQDFNCDGVKDAVIFEKAEGKRAPPQIIAIDGQTHQEMWVNEDIFAYAFSGGNPIRIIDDSNGDSIPDIAIGAGRWGATGADIHILDGTNGEQLKLIEYEEQTEFSDWNMAQPVYSISTIDDVSGDGFEDMIIQRSVVINDEDVIVVEIVDPETGSLTRQIPLGLAVVKDNGDINSDGKTDILVSQGNSLYCLDGAYGLSILSPQDDKTVDDKFLLEWDLKGVECEVFVDGISYGSYTNGEVYLTLSGGKHEIIVETTDEFGGIVSDTITIKVSESNISLIINISTVITFLIFVVLLFLMKRSKLNKSTELWREKRKKIIDSKNSELEKSKKDVREQDSVEEQEDKNSKAIENNSDAEGGI